MHHYQSHVQIYFPDSLFIFLFPDLGQVFLPLFMVFCLLDQFYCFVSYLDGFFIVFLSCFFLFIACCYKFFFFTIHLSAFLLLELLPYFPPHSLIIIIQVILIYFFQYFFPCIYKFYSFHTISIFEFVAVLFCVSILIFLV